MNEVRKDQTLTSSNPTGSQKKPLIIPQPLGGQHPPDNEHTGHAPVTFPYPTLGMPIPNTPFNFTLVPDGEDYYNY